MSELLPNHQIMYIIWEDWINKCYIPRISDSINGYIYPSINVISIYVNVRYTQDINGEISSAEAAPVDELPLPPRPGEANRAPGPMARFSPWNVLGKEMVQRTARVSKAVRGYLLMSVGIC